MPSPELPRILLVDDDRKLCDLIANYLAPLGYHVEAAHDGPSGVARAQAEPWHAILLDVMLPGLDGFEALKRIRAQSNVPVLMLTARGEEADRIVGLEIGADDYLPKTFSPRELLARLRAVTRRSSRPQSGDAPRTIDCGPLHVNLDAYCASLDDQPLNLTPVEFALLASLVKAKGRVKTRDALLEEVRDREYEVFDRSVDVHIAALRKKLGDDAANPRFIRTVRGAGYMFLDPSA